MREVAYLPTKERECIRDMMRVRNNWAHCSAVLPGKDTIIADLIHCISSLNRWKQMTNWLVKWIV